MQTTLRKLTVAWLLAIFLLLPARTRAETGVPVWTNRYNGPGNRIDQAAAVVVDGSNNVIVTGYSDGGGSYYDYSTIKYSSAGVPLWTNLYNSPGNGDDRATALAVDASNNVIVTGYSDSPQGHPSPLNHDYATVKYSSDGTPLWTNRYDGPAKTNDYPTAVVVDHSGDVIVTGYSAGTNSPLSPDYDYATIKYSSAGVPVWTNRYNGPVGWDDKAAAVAVDDSNNVIVTGNSYKGSGYPSYMTIKYSSAGVLLWTNRYIGPASWGDFATAVVVDGSNSVIVTGYSYGGASAQDYATIKYSSAGLPLWTNRYNGTGNWTDLAQAVAVDRSNNVIVTGYSATIGGSPYKWDYVTIKYSSDGLPLWTNRYNGPGNYQDCASAVAVDACDNVVVTGYSMGSGGGYGYATIKYSSAGLPIWTNRYEAGLFDPVPVFLALDRSNNVILAGTSPGSGTANDITTIKYICVPSPVMTSLPLTNGTFQMRVDEMLQPGTLVIEASTDLAGWAAVFTNTTPTNVLFYTDPNAGSLPARFYRVYQFP